MSVRSLRSFFQNILRVFEWAPVIWKDRDWDYAFVDNILLYKYKRLYKQLHKDSKFVQYEKRQLQSLRILIKLLERITTDFFYDDLLEDHKKFVFNVNYRQILKENSDGFFVMSWEYLKDGVWVKSVELETQHHKEIMLMTKRTDLLRQRDRRLADTMVTKYSGSWWS